MVTFTDAQGEVTREIRNYRFAALLTANGVTVRGWSNGPEITEWHPDGTATRSVMGVVGRHLPRGGNVLQHAGRMVVELDASGDPVGDPVMSGVFDSPELVCAAFEG